LELLRRTSCDLPADMECAIQSNLAQEKAGSPASSALQAMLENAALARKQNAPICQDTGMLVFYWKVPRATDTTILEKQAGEAVKQATSNGWLRQNTIETLTGRSIEENVSEGVPACHFEQEDRSDIEVWLMQKGGGCENMSAQYSLPDETLMAGRDLAGVRACVLNAVWKAQGFGCAPGILGVCIGSDRAEGFAVAKQQLLRPLSDHAAEPSLAKLEERLLREANELAIGPMGMAGRTTLLGVKLAARPRLPAAFFVSIAYMCWACRRRGVRAGASDAKITQWLG